MKEEGRLFLSRPCAKTIEPGFSRILVLSCRLLSLHESVQRSPSMFARRSLISGCLQVRSLSNSTVSFPRLRFRVQSQRTRVLSTSWPSQLTPIRNMGSNSRIPQRVAVCQICSTEDVSYNLRISEDVVRKAAEAGATVSTFVETGLVFLLNCTSFPQACFLPEAADFIVPTQDQCYDLSQPLASHTYTIGLQRLAKELGIWIFAGIHELPTVEGDGQEVVDESVRGKKVYNSLVVIDDQGLVQHTYRKVSYSVSAKVCGQADRSGAPL
jgi:hypothetical protein